LTRLTAFIAGLSVVLLGCEMKHVGEFLTPAGPPSEEQISRAYETTELGEDEAATVLDSMPMAKYEQLSQSESVVACYGQKKNGKKTWMTMIAFDEQDMTARRKYMSIYDARPKFLGAEPWEAMRVRCEATIDEDKLEGPFANANARLLAIFEQMVENYENDLDAVQADSKQLRTRGLMLRQALGAALTELENSPAKVGQLNSSEGVLFTHLSLDEGRIKMQQVEGIVKVKIWLGSLVKNKVGIDGKF